MIYSLQRIERTYPLCDIPFCFLQHMTHLSFSGLIEGNKESHSVNGKYTLKILS